MKTDIHGANGLVRLTDLTPSSRAAVTSVAAEPMDSPAWVPTKPAHARTVAFVSSAGLGMRGDPPFRGGDSGYRSIGHRVDAADILMSHVSVNYDRTGFQLDLETILPRRRLDELVAAGVVGAAADEHYSFMGATDPKAMEAKAQELAQAMLAKGVDTAVLLPV